MIKHDLNKTLEALTAQFPNAINGIQRGIEREALRIKPSGVISQQGHPQGVGSALTNDHVTTDFSESLLEFITPVSTSAEQTLAQLKDLQKFTLSQMAMTAEVLSLVLGHQAKENGHPNHPCHADHLGTMKAQPYRRWTMSCYGLLVCHALLNIKMTLYSHSLVTQTLAA